MTESNDGRTGSAVLRVTGRAIPLRGDSIDTDRIMPARYLRCVTFEGLEKHVFEDDRESAGESTHPFDRKEFQGAAILVAGENFGCGSSREHAPQGLQRWGIRAIVARSFAEIFFGNCTALGIPCVTLEAGDLERLQGIVEASPEAEVIVDLQDRKVTVHERADKCTAFDAAMPEGPRGSFLKGTWDATAALLAAPREMDSVVGKLPYFANWR